MTHKNPARLQHVKFYVFGPSEAGSTGSSSTTSTNPNILKEPNSFSAVQLTIMLSWMFVNVYDCKR